MKAKPSILPKADGPYVVTDLKNLASRKGPIETKPQMALCRCGQSGNKPFCDSTHNKIGFNSDEQTDRATDKRDNYAGKDVVIHDNRSICAHAGYCTDELSSVFKLKQEPWIDPNGAAAEEIIALVKRCPSGALSYSKDGTEHRDQDREPAILVAPNGPYVVTGGPDLVGVEHGEGVSTEHFTLCRCGGSKNKPFCDGTHWDRKFDEHAQ